MYFFDEFQLAMIQTEIKIEPSYLIMFTFLSVNKNTNIHTLQDININNRNDFFNNIHIKF